MRPNDRDHRIGGIENTKGFLFYSLQEDFNQFRKSRDRTHPATLTVNTWL